MLACKVNLQVNSRQPMPELSKFSVDGRSNNSIEVSRGQGKRKADIVGILSPRSIDSKPMAKINKSKSKTRFDFLDKRKGSLPVLGVGRMISGESSR